MTVRAPHDESRNKNGRVASNSARSRALRISRLMGLDAYFRLVADQRRLPRPTPAAHSGVRPSAARTPPPGPLARPAGGHHQHRGRRKPTDRVQHRAGAEYAWAGGLGRREIVAGHPRKQQHVLAAGGERPDPAAATPTASTPGGRRPPAGRRSSPAGCVDPPRRPPGGPRGCPAAGAATDPGEVGRASMAASPRSLAARAAAAAISTESPSRSRRRPRSPTTADRCPLASPRAPSAPGPRGLPATR